MKTGRYDGILGALWKLFRKKKKTSHRLGNKTFAKHMSDKVWFPEYTKTSKPSNKKTNNPFKKWRNYLKRHLTQKRWADDRHRRRCSTPCYRRNVNHNNETTLPPIRMDKIWNTKNTKRWQGCGARWTLIHHCLRVFKKYSPFGKQLGTFLQN